jgi:hypothetical protein
MWAASAEALRAQTESLQQLAAGSLSAYEQTIDELDSTWQSIRTGMSA